MPIYQEKLHSQRNLNGNLSWQGIIINLWLVFTITILSFLQNHNIDIALSYESHDIILRKNLHELSHWQFCWIDIRQVFFSIFRFQNIILYQSASCSRNIFLSDRFSLLKGTFLLDTLYTILHKLKEARISPTLYNGSLIVAFLLNKMYAF